MLHHHRKPRVSTNFLCGIIRSSHVLFLLCLSGILLNFFLSYADYVSVLLFHPPIPALSAFLRSFRYRLPLPDHDVGWWSLKSCRWTRLLAPGTSWKKKILSKSVLCDAYIWMAEMYDCWAFEEAESLKAYKQRSTFLHAYKLLRIRDSEFKNVKFLVKDD